MFAIATVLLMLSRRAPDILVGLRSTRLERVPVVPMDHSVLAIKASREGGLLIALGLLGLSLVGRQQRLLGLVLTGTGFLAPAYHIYTTELVSMQKHIAYGLFFVAPLAGLATARISEYKRGKAIGPRWLAGCAICLLMFTAGFRQAQEIYAEWPNSEELIRVLRSQVRPGRERILAEEADVPRYYLQDTVAYWQWNHLYWFPYTDKSGRQFKGVEAYKAAIREGYFDLVMLHYGHNAATDTQSVTG